MSEELPIISFGKYKGKPVTDLLSDTNYIEWLKQQTWFEKHKNIYNIVINQSITEINSKTPEHNKLQNLFLNKDNQLKLINYINKIEDINNIKTKIIFEDKFNWDFGLYYNSKIIYCELKPLLGDDYPCVLRKLKKQINFTKNSIYAHYAELFKLEWQAHMLHPNDVHRHNEELINDTKFILLIETFSAKHTTKEDLKKIFLQSNIQVIFLEEVLNPLDNVKIISKENLIEENKILKEKLQKASIKIYQLEEELTLLSNI